MNGLGGCIDVKGYVDIEEILKWVVVVMGEWLCEWFFSECWDRDVCKIIEVELDG